MKSTLLVVLLALGAVLQANGLNLKLAKNSEQDNNLFVRSLRNLQREPPISTGQARDNKIDINFIEQPLDHFDENEERTWQMRYMENAELFQEGGPIFIWVGGEWEITADSISGGHFYDMAKEHNAMLYYTEHRYYGQSRPTADITVDNLKYLHVKQALADLAHFIRYQRANTPGLANSKVILAGGSYSATMVVWFYRLYPELIDGGWASSAPLLAKVNFVEYKEIVGRAIVELGNQQCYNRIQNGIAELEQMFANKRGAEAKAMMKLCNNFDENNDLDLWSLFGSISNIFSSVVQYQTGDDIPFVCDLLMSYEDDASAMAGFLLLVAGDDQCIDVSYKDTLNYYIDSSYWKGAARPWYYQTCNEYGWYQTSGSVNQPFGSKFPVTLYTTMCADIFGDEYSNAGIQAKVEQTNVDFGGMSAKADKIHMTHGALDPWHPMGHGLEQNAQVIPRASHCADLGSISDADSAEMRDNKLVVAAKINIWLMDIKSSSKDNSTARKFIKQLVQH